MLRRLQPAPVRHAFLKQTVAIAQRAFELVGARAVIRVDAERETVEKTSPFARRPGEEAVHRRRQP